MSNTTKFMSYFEKQLRSVIESKAQKVEQMQKLDEEMFERYGDKSPEQVRLHKMYMKQERTFVTGINLNIDSEELAEQVHTKICELIKQKSYPIKEVGWYNFIGSNKWHFSFEY